MSAFLMPSLGADMESGILVEKLIAAGEPVRRGDVIGAVETQKGVIEMEVFEDGILENWLVEIGTRVPVGTPLALVRDLDEGAQETPEVPEPAPTEEPIPSEPQPEPIMPEDPPPFDPPPPSQTPELPETPPPEVELPPPQSQRVRASPAARRLAVQRGIDIASVPASADGTITRANVEAAMLCTPQPSADLAMRAAIAAAMSRSKREIPHYYLSHQIDLTTADEFLRDANADRPPEKRLLMGVLVAKAIAKTLAKYSEFNGRFEQNTFAPSDAVHLGMAINIRGGGLVAPALFDSETRSLDELMFELSDLVTRVRAGRFRARELSDATITLTSLGDRGVDQLYGVIYPPQVAIVGIGTPRLQPMIYNGAVTPRLVSTLTLAADHRVSDGHRGALFLRAVSKKLQHPEDL